jgi:hypothetical protein
LIGVTLPIAEAGEYEFEVELRSQGSYDFDAARAVVTLSLDGVEKHRSEYGWSEGKTHRVRFAPRLEAADHRLEMRVQPLEATQLPPREGELGEESHVRCSLQRVLIDGPVSAGRRVHPPHYDRFFTRDEPPTERAEQRAYAQEVLARFTRRAFRSAPPSATVERLVDIALQVAEQPGQTFEAGIGQAMAAVLASPRFLFRFEAALTDPPAETHPLVDEATLATRLSYFLWGSMPDDKLFRLVDAGRLREELAPQMERMLRDGRSAEFRTQFVGQWLRARDVRTISIDPVAVLGHQEEYDRLLQQFRSLRGRRGQGTPEEEAEYQRIRARFREFRTIRDMLDDDVRSAMRAETEQAFAHIVLDNRSLLELLDADYVFVNQRLAQHYGIPDIRGEHLRKVTLPEGSPRGGLLTQGTMLVVTSNPTRTSPVKRGLFVLENILGTPAPPPPAVVPELEDAAASFTGESPQLRDLLAKHREAPLCTSCHARMDPLGLALENFSALGTWRDTENQRPIDPAGQLLSGTRFSDLKGLKRALVTEHRLDFYRCLTQKLLIYALGRGLEDTDEETVDQIVARLDAEGGRFSALLSGVIDSAPFQRMRRLPTAQLSAAP